MQYGMGLLPPMDGSEPSSPSSAVSPLHPNSDVLLFCSVMFLLVIPHAITMNAPARSGSGSGSGSVSCLGLILILILIPILIPILI